MKLQNEFTVAADVETVWRTLLDMEGVAGCLPGAAIEPGDAENTYNGSMRMKLGAMTVSYRGSATFEEIDDENHRAVISLRAREAKGQGTAMATITNRVEQAEAGAKVTAETDLHITGPQARFGRGVMEDVATHVLSDFSECLERQISGPPEPAEPAGRAWAGEPAARQAAQGRARESRPEAFDVGAALSQTTAGRAARIAAPVLLGVAVVILLRRR